MYLIKKQVYLPYQNKGGDKMTIIEAYVIMYDYLDDYYEKTKSDAVGSLLGDMFLLNAEEWSTNPNTWGDWMHEAAKYIKEGIPLSKSGISEDRCRTADPATWEDWMNVAGKYIKDNKIDKEYILQITIDFLVFHKEEFGFEVDDAIEYFEKIKANK